MDMTTEERRQEILNMLSQSEKPIKGSEFASKLNVSRQVIVQDIAILRAEGVEVVATPSGYMVLKEEKGKIFKTLVTKHFDIEQVEDELMTIINNGGRVVDVVVNHSVYGNMKGLLNLSCKAEVDNFLEEIKNGKAEFLSSLTGGVHIHTIEVQNSDVFIKIKDELKEKGYLVNI